MVHNYFSNSDHEGRISDFFAPERVALALMTVHVPSALLFSRCSRRSVKRSACTRRQRPSRGSPPSLSLISSTLYRALCRTPAPSSSWSWRWVTHFLNLLFQKPISVLRAVDKFNLLLFVSERIMLTYSTFLRNVGLLWNSAYRRNCQPRPLLCPYIPVSPLTAVLSHLRPQL